MAASDDRGGALLARSSSPPTPFARRAACANLQFLLLPVLIGIPLIVFGLRAKAPRIVAATNRRLLVISETGQVTQYEYAYIADVDVVREQAQARGGGLLGAVIAAGLQAALDSHAARQQKATPGYWSRGSGVRLIQHDRREQTIADLPRELVATIGMLLARCVLGRQGDQHPAAIDFAGARQSYIDNKEKTHRHKRVTAKVMAVITGLVVVAAGVFYAVE